MFSMNPAMLMQMLQQGQNPQQLVLSLLQSQSNSPLGQNLLNLAQNGQTAEIEKIVRNLYAQQGGKNFDQDFEAFKRAWGL